MVKGLRGDDDGLSVVESTRRVPLPIPECERRASARQRFPAMPLRRRLVLGSLSSRMIRLDAITLSLATALERCTNPTNTLRVSAQEQ